MPKQLHNVDLTTGKLNLSVPLVSLSGPNKFGADVSIHYSTLGLMASIKTWNEEPTTGILGLGWNMPIPSIIRLGNGSLRDRFLLNGVLLLPKTSIVQSTSIPSPLQFETVEHSLNKIEYFWEDEYWQITDSEGIVHTYGSIQKEREDAVEWGIRWVNREKNGSGIVVWLGHSSHQHFQEKYAIKWNLARKQNLFGQQVNYFYDSVERPIGIDNQGQNYTVATYLKIIDVKNGEYVKFSYKEKEIKKDKDCNSWQEYPYPRVVQKNNGKNEVIPYQDRIETRYLDTIKVYNSYGKHGTLISTICFNYGFLWDEYTCCQNRSFMNKRLLLDINKILPNNLPVEPKTIFDYWGYHQEDGFKEYFNKSSFNALKIANEDMDGSNFSGFQSYTDDYGNTYYQLFGHLKNYRSALGAITWYSYCKAKDNYRETIGPGFFDTYQMKLDLKGIPYPTHGEWENPTPYWCSDGALVLTFFSPDEDLVYTEIYEWLGQWVKIKKIDFPEKLAIKNKDNFQLICGTGIVAILRTEREDNQGSVIILSRHPYLPGQWITKQYLKNHKIRHGITDRGKDGGSITYHNANTVVDFCYDNNIISVLDKEELKLHFFVLQGNIWQNYSLSLDVENHTLASITYKNTVFVIAIPTRTNSNNQKPKYWLITPEPSSPSGGFINTGEIEGIDFFATRDTSYLTEASIVPCSGYILIKAHLWKTTLIGSGPTASYYSTPFFKPLVVSWDLNTLKLYYQKMKLDNDWYWPAEDWALRLPFQGGGNMSAISSNVYYTKKDSKLALRYLAQNGTDSNGNFGWTKENFSNDEGNHDYFSLLPLIDTTIVTNNIANITYNLFQFNPGTESWHEITQISEAMLNHIDWQEIVQILLFIIDVITIIFAFLAPLLMDVELIALAGRVFEFTAPLSALGSRLVGTLATMVTGSSVAGEIAGFGSSTLLSIGDNFVMNYILGDLLKGLYAGYRDATGSYLIVGQQHGRLHCFSKKWSPNPGEFTWNEITTFDPEGVTTDSAKAKALYTNILETNENNKPTNQHFCGVTNNNFLLGNHFIAYDYQTASQYQYTSGFYISSLSYSMNTGQVALFRNNELLSIQGLPMQEIPASYYETDSNFKVYDAFSKTPLNSIAYQLGSDKDYEEGEMPMLSHPSGAILGFIGKYTIRWFTSGLFSSEQRYYQTNFKKALMFGLFMVRDEKLEGLVDDYTVNKVAIDDGYQVNNTHFVYMPEHVAFDSSINTIRYNRVHVAKGYETYKKAVEKNGWIETYFYNGGINYKDSPFQQDKGNLNFDPATEANLVNTNNASQTNVNEYYRLMTGQIYCERSMSMSSTLNLRVGYEKKREQTFYMGFERPVKDDSGRENPFQKVYGVVQKAKVIYTAPADSDKYGMLGSTKPSTIENHYYFYDLDILSGPMIPGSTANKTKFTTGKDTVMLLGESTFSNNYQDWGEGVPKNDSATGILGVYRQKTPGFAIKDNGTFIYNDFKKWHLYSPIVQTTVWQAQLKYSTINFNTMELPLANSSISPANNDTFPPFDLFQGEWQVVQSEITTWKNFNNNIWHPQARFRWRGDLAGEKTQVIPIFPWLNPGTNQEYTQWIKVNSINELSTSGQVLTTSNAADIPTTTIYDKYENFSIATFTNAGYANGIAAYIGFENYENLSRWSLKRIKPNGKITVYTENNLSTDNHFSDTGNNSLEFSTKTDKWVLCYSLTQTENIQVYQKNWILVVKAGVPRSAQLIFNVSALDKNNVTNNATLGKTKIQESNQSSDKPQWKNYIVPFILPEATEPYTEIQIHIDIDAKTNPDLCYLDNVYIIPYQNSKFFAYVYDSNSWTISSTASLNDLKFMRRPIYDLKNHIIGAIVKDSSHSNAILKANLNIIYFSREGNNNLFNPRDPNVSLKIVAPVNASSDNIRAGDYFDFRDKINPWNGGIAKNNGLYIKKEEKALYPISTDYTFGLGIRVQLKVASIASPNDTSLPSCALSMGNYKVTWKAEEKTFIASGLNQTINPVQVDTPMNDWLMFMVHRGFYFYADGKQIFAVEFVHSHLPTGNFTIECIREEIVCKDIVLFKDPMVQADFIDGSGKIRQQQKLVEM